jgi:mRNA interferase MazF
LSADLPERGDLWIADVPGDKRRPVVVLTRSTFIARLANVTVAPVVTTVRDIPTEIIVGETHGIDRPSAVSFDNILTISQRHLVRRVGWLNEGELHEACQALTLALGCD